VEQTAVLDERHSSRQLLLSYRLQKILDSHLPEHISASRKLVVRYGRPSALVRYWLPAGLLLAFSGTFFRILFKKKAAILTWVRELGVTVLDFWANWVVEPLRKVIGTIRHDEDSEVALLSKRSLEGDRASLERMVVDFVVDHAADGLDQPLGDPDIALLRRKVKEGDLTPILRAYERALRRPFVGTLRGDLIRTLLIQIQKTKVDVEVAISGIDSLLKSQELVFGCVTALCLLSILPALLVLPLVRFSSTLFSSYPDIRASDQLTIDDNRFVGLTPGILVTLGVARWIHNTFSNRKGFNRGKRQGQMMRILR
jgi:nuclear-control-of-ATPase protein 2